MDSEKQINKETIPEKFYPGKACLLEDSGAKAHIQLP